MQNAAALKSFQFGCLHEWRTALVLAVAILAFAAPIFAESQFETDQAGTTLTIGDAPEMEFVAYGKTVIVKKRAKGVLTFGGDIIVEGEVSGDVAAVGGTITQKKNAYIGGDVFVIGGKYLPEDPSPRREAGKETVMYAGYEDEVRNLTQNPGQLLTPTYDAGFFAWRLVSILFWFVITYALAIIAPGAVGKSIARFQLSTLKVMAFGLFSFAVTTILIAVVALTLPGYLSAVLGLMAFVLVMLAYVFGRVVLNLSLGKLISKRLFPNTRSESLAAVIGVAAWTVVLSIPYAWPVILIGLFGAGIGLVLTARANQSWKAA